MAFAVLFRHVREISKDDYYLRHVCSSVCMELGSHWTDFRKICYMCIFRKSVEKIQVSWKSKRNNGYFTRRSICIFDCAHLFLEWQMFRTKVVQKIRTYIITFNYVKKSCRLWD